MFDVICAAATPPGTSALAVVRLSGGSLFELLPKILEPMHPGSWEMGRSRRVRLVDELGVYDDGVVVLNRAPRSYTGEHTAEISCHGNPVVVERLLDAVRTAGGRMAKAGEFTRRAVVNGKLDLVAAEAVLQLSRAVTRQGLAVARAGLDGSMHRRIVQIRAEWIEVAAELEARLDYPGDELARIDDSDLMRRMKDATASCERLAGTHRTARVWVDGARVALVGPVNAGKSTLFNALVGRKRALVHDSPGTTRDVIEVPTLVAGVPVVVLDTAGERTTDNPVEAAGLAMARELVDEADLIVVVIPAGHPDAHPVVERILERTADRARVIVYNGIDRDSVPPAPEGAIPISAKRGDGLEPLRQAVRTALIGKETRSETLAVASQRQRDQWSSAARCGHEAERALPIAGVAVAADAVTRAIECLDELTGADTREDVLDALFARFCIGK